MCSASSILCLHVLIHKISTICILDFLLFGLVLILSAILTPHSLSLTQFKALPTFSHKLLKHSSSQTSQIPHSVQKHEGTGRYEAHLWDNGCNKEGQSRKGRQAGELQSNDESSVYLGKSSSPLSLSICFEETV
ncbi:uncharacterized protein LOC126582714 isoform X2 [Malus sylvestris]|uniref:uncharacterized protein LOC126582714 isoform X2 n=1 Tax=Malus sylvestris TaxID=3752 RepID=UPI0021AD0DAD|nr:uncharacterized protein LOC126582714 isoform X2 [Malus sylvestris]